MDVWYYLRELVSSRPALSIIYYTLLIVALVVGYMWKVKPFVRQILEFLEDWRGEHERPGVIPRPGVMVRLAELERYAARVEQLEKFCKDHGLDTSAVGKIENAAKKAAREILQEHPLFPGLKTGEQYAVTKLRSDSSKANTESVSSSGGSGTVPSSRVDSESLLRTSSFPRVPSSR